MSTDRGQCGLQHSCFTTTSGKVFTLKKYLFPCTFFFCCCQTTYTFTDLTEPSRKFWFCLFSQPVFFPEVFRIISLSSTGSAAVPVIRTLPWGPLSFFMGNPDLWPLLGFFWTSWSNSGNSASPGKVLRCSPWILVPLKLLWSPEP